VTATLIDHLERHARERPDGLAVREITADGVGRTFTWHELRAAVAGLAARLGNRSDNVLIVSGGIPSNRSRAFSVGSRRVPPSRPSRPS
jgi:acyl-CoA synthetase (AMP-forming)/AMP-acid ligase II